MTGRNFTEIYKKVQRSDTAASIIVRSACYAATKKVAFSIRPVSYEFRLTFFRMIEQEIKDSVTNNRPESSKTKL